MLSRAQELQVRAQKCRELAETAMTEEGRSILREIAQRYEREATSAEFPADAQPLSEAAL